MKEKEKKLPRPGRLLKAADRLVLALDKEKKFFLGLDEEKIIAKAVRQTGLSDFGDDSLWEPLEILCRHTRSGKKMTFLGRLNSYDNVLRRLKNRLKMEALFKTHREILAEEIRRPIFIIGLPRTGTTLLQRLLARDPANRVLYNWEMAEPVPPPAPETFHSDGRIRRDKLRWSLLNYSAPGFKAIHESGADVPDECVALMANDLNSIWFNIGIDCREYLEWVHCRCSEDIYRRHRRQLQLLQWRFPEVRWVLKTPYHLYGLEALLKVYPDACVIHTHRHPFQVMPSISSLFSTMRGVMQMDVNRREVAQECLEMLGRWMDKGLAAREREEKRPGSQARFIDLDFRELVKDPEGALERIYACFGIEFSAGARRRMEEYLREYPRNKYGKHVYTLEEFGLEREAIRRRFSPYLEAYAPVARSLQKPEAD